MAIFEQIGKKLSDMGQGVAQGTKNLTDTARLNGLISDEEKNIAKLITELGQGYYNLHKSDPEGELAQIVSAINEAYNNIEQHKEQIKTIKGVTKCANCGADVANGAAFCANCGTPNAAAQAAAPAAKFCANCGTAVEAGAAFCNNCGNKL